MKLFSVSLSLLAALPPVVPQGPDRILRERIINGVDAPVNRYPYSVSLQHIDFHFCGASLIAPDIALSAAHCAGETFGDSNFNINVNPHKVSDPLESVEVFGVQDFELHPFYETLSLYDHDYMIIKLDGESTKDPIRLNTNESLPAAGSSLQVMGWGTTIGGISAPSDTLQEVDVVAISNQQCSLGFAYGDLISPDSLCAIEANRGACQGDSGGPLILPGTDSTEDIQLGVVSWGYGCALPGHPGVYARVSEEFGWIRYQVCRLSANPPDYFGCDAEDGVTFSPAPSGSPSAPTTSPAPTREQVSVIISLEFDAYPRETGVAIHDASGRVVAYTNPGHYTSSPFSKVTHQVELGLGAEYTFVLYDSYGDGFGGRASLYLGDNLDDSRTLVHYDSSFAPSFATTYEVSFVADEGGVLSNIYPTQAPSVESTPSPTIVPLEPTSGAPSDPPSDPPSDAPIVLSSPPAPASFPVCNVCGSPSSTVTKMNANLNHHEFFDDDLILQCSDLRDLGTEGLISTANCARISALIFDECGCTSPRSGSSAASRFLAHGAILVIAGMCMI